MCLREFVDEVCCKITTSVSVLPLNWERAEMSIIFRQRGIVGNRVALAVYTFRQRRYMFPVLAELAVVPILPEEDATRFQSSRGPRGQSFGAMSRNRKSTGFSPEGAGRVAGR